MTEILKCGLCGADAGNEPYHATIDEARVHICDGCFYPEHYDLGVLWRQRERMLAKLNSSEWQRDELLEVLKYCRNKIAYMQAHGEWYSPGRAIEMADAAIAKATGEQA